jgi:predicted ABC-type ATPase
VPDVIVLGGPNGAGKSTTAPGLLRDYLGLGNFVNADDIARGLSAFAPESVAREAGRIMLVRLRELAAKRQDFAFETTLASRSFAPWLAGLREKGYRLHLFYLWVPTPGMSIERIAGRVRAGGHHVPDHVVRRRHRRSAANLLELYLPLADDWRVLDNSGTSGPRRVAEGRRGVAPAVYDEHVWRTIREAAEA